MSPSNIFLHDHPLSSYAQKIRIALREKNLPFTAKTPDSLGSGSDVSTLISINPRKEVPALIDGDVKLFDSTVILAYLEEAYPEKKLLPDSPKDRAEARMIEEICDTHYEAINWAAGEINWMGRTEGNKELEEKLMGQIKAQAGVVQDWLSERLGGKQAAVNGYGAQEGSTLQKWHERIKAQASVKETFEEFEKVIPKVAGMKEAFLNGRFKREYRDHRLEFLVKSGGINIVLEGLKRDNIRFSWPEPAKL